MSVATIIVDLVANVDQFKSEMQSVSDDVTKLGQDMTAAGATMSKNLTAPIVGVGAALLASAVNVGNYADKIQDLAQQSGLTTDEIQRFRAVAAVAGVPMDTMANAAQMLTRRLASGEEGSADMTRAMEKLGISVMDAAGNMRPVGELTQEATAALADMEDITQRNIMSTQIFGRGASEIAPILGMGSDAIRDAAASAERFGGILDDEALEAAKAFQVEMAQLTASMGRVAREIGLAVIPVLSQFVAFAQDNLVPIVLRVVEIFAAIPAPVQTVIAVVAGLVAAIGPVLVVAGLVVQAIGAIIPVLAAVATALAGPLLVPIAIAVAAIGAVYLAFKAWGVIGDYVKAMVGTVVDLLRGALASVLDWILGPIRQVAEGFRWLYDVVVGNSYVPDMVDGIAQEFSRLPSVMVEPAEDATRKVAGAFEGMAQSVAGSMSTLGAALSGAGILGGQMDSGASGVTANQPIRSFRTGGGAREALRAQREAAGIAQAQGTGWAFAGSQAAASGPSMQRTPPQTINNNFDLSGWTIPKSDDPRAFVDAIARELQRRNRAGGANPLGVVTG